ncbi:MAG: thiamine phosphate synthase [Sulfurospirillaceae bacterium]|nr:thiamine phosphate synthase [Sulfurospirillaceae bacterium]MCK9546075.1 thiamine phosphate synthase [Sulfurospirillaceae bacterium]
MQLKGLYALTDERYTPFLELESKVLELLKAGVKVVQLRDKNSKDEELLEKALNIQQICKKYGAIFIINDRVNLAKEIDADGVHIGIEDESLIKTRELLPDKIIGVSCYDDLERAILAQNQGASYVAFGSFFPSSTKPDAKKAPLELLKRAKKELKIPICVIGGINETNISLLKDADLISIVKAVYEPREIKENIKILKELI